MATEERGGTLSLMTLSTQTRVLAVAALALFFVAGGVVADDAKATPEARTKIIKMDAENWEFIPSEITVHEGTKVILKIRSFHAPHRFDLKSYGLKVPLPQDETTTIEFVADIPGKHTFRCGRPCGNGCSKMRGKLIVLAVPAADP